MKSTTNQEGPVRRMSSASLTIPQRNFSTIPLDNPINADTFFITEVALADDTKAKKSTVSPLHMKLITTVIEFRSHFVEELHAAEMWSHETRFLLLQVGLVTVEPLSFEQHQRSEFVSRFLDRCISQSTSVSPVPNDSELLFNRVVAVLKRPTWKNCVSNRAEVLTPLPLLSHLLSSIDGRGGSQFVLQRFVKSKSGHACLYRVQWRASATGKSVVTWNISKKSGFKSFDWTRDNITT
eukprot:gene43585-58047_t